MRVGSCFHGLLTNVSIPSTRCAAQTIKEYAGVPACRHTIAIAHDRADRVALAVQKAREALAGQPDWDA